MTVSAAFPSRFTARLIRATVASLLLVSLAGCASTKHDAVTTGSIPARVSMTPLDSMTATQLADAEKRSGQLMYAIRRTGMWDCAMPVS